MAQNVMPAGFAYKCKSASDIDGVQSDSLERIPPPCGLDEGDVERMELPWPERHFDAVLMSEVLEHLVDPWSVVKRVAAKLRPGALVLASSPNVAQFAILRGLLANRWELTKTGVMDRTHLRWFTGGTYRRMFEDAGIRVERSYAMAPPGPFGSIFNAVTLGRLRHLTVRQICIVGRAT